MLPPEPAARARLHFNHNPSHPQPQPPVQLPSTAELAQQHFNYLQDPVEVAGAPGVEANVPVPTEAPITDPAPQASDDLPSCACKRRGKWEYGRYIATPRGRTLRWFMARAFTEAELESAHFRALREAVEPTAAMAPDTEEHQLEAAQTEQNTTLNRSLQRLQRQLA